MTFEKLTFGQLADRYCDRNTSQKNGWTVKGLREVLRKQAETQCPDGWCLLECQDLSSSYMGSLTIVPYGPNNTWKAPPTTPVSPRGLASDMSMVVAVLTKGEFASELENC